MPLDTASLIDAKRQVKTKAHSAFAVASLVCLWVSPAAYAVSPVTSIEAESMTLPQGAKVVSDPSASGGQAVRFATNAQATASFSLGGSVNYLSVNAKGTNCSGWPQLRISVDGKLLGAVTISSSSWSVYRVSANLAAGQHLLGISMSNWRSYIFCKRYLYVDAVAMYAPPAPPSPSSPYDGVVLADHPVALWDMTGANRIESDLTGNSHAGTYSSLPQTAQLPNGDSAVDFSGQYMTVPSSPMFSISTTKQLTWEAWIRPDALQWSPASDPNSYGYVNFLGKCQNYAPSCEWEARMYSSTNQRCNRLSAYAFNPSAGYGSGAYWQPTCGLFQPGQWLHVVGEYQTENTPAGCNAAYPGTIDIWVDAVEWNANYHYPTGCMSQYQVTPTAGNSPLNVGTVALDTWFPGAVGKLAIYDYLLSQEQIVAHFSVMTGSQPSGSCTDTCTLP